MKLKQDLNKKIQNKQNYKIFKFKNKVSQQET